MLYSIADRFETMATAPAAYQNIPLIHIQGGEFAGQLMKKLDTL